MRIPRIYQQTDLSTGQTFILTDNAAHHIKNVLRLKNGAPIVIFNGTGSEFLGEITQIDNRKVSVTLHSHQTVSSESPLKLHLVQAISRPVRMDLTLQKATELGVTEITPLITDFVNLKQNEKVLNKRMAHWESIIIHSTEQCHRTQLPTLNPILSFKEWLDIPTGALCLMADPHGEQTLLDIQNKPTQLTLLIGPEGGLSEAEIQLAQSKGVLPIKLGPRILRTETAAIAMIAICQAHFGDLT